MSSVDRVIDYMRGLPQGAEHAKTYATQFTERVIRGELKVVDGVAEEKAIISNGEKEVLARLNMQAKFTRSGFADNLRLGLGVTAGKSRHVRKEKVAELDFRGSRDWYLAPAKSHALYSGKESTVQLYDEEEKRAIMSRCPTLSGTEFGDIYMASVHERLSIPTDMRHVMMKAYLLLMDYNLAVTSKYDTIEQVDDVAFDVMEHIDSVDRLATMSAHDIVVDAAGFTPQELGILGLACEEYPPVWYAGRNIYTQCNMSADDLVIISDGAIDIDRSLVWGSPDRLYNTIWSLAAKMNALPSLLSAIENMRGKPRMVANMFAKTSGNILQSMVPLSYSMNCALAGETSKCVVTNMPGFVSTSLSLVSDLLYGEMFECVASCVGESLGAYGTLLSSANPATNPTINGILRDYGLQHTNARDNVLLQNWEILAGRPLTWEFGVHLKEYVIGLAGQITNGADIVLPQLLLCIPALRAVNTAYGMARGWKGREHILKASKEQRADDADRLNSVGWLMGLIPCRPKVFLNRSGNKPSAMGYQVSHLSAEGEGDLMLNDVQIWPEDSLGGRIDENEEVASDLFRTEYGGTKCALVYSYTDKQWVNISDFVQGANRSTLTGTAERKSREAEPIKPTPDSEMVVSGVNWGSLKKKGNAELVESVRALARSNAIAPSTKPRHVRVTSSGVATVGNYEIDGDERCELLNKNGPDPQTGERYKVREINNPEGSRSVVHGVVTDLMVHGLLSSADHGRASSLFMDDSMKDELTTAEEAASLCNHWKMGLRVINPDGEMAVTPGEYDHHVQLLKTKEGYKAAVLEKSEEGEYEVKNVKELELNQASKDRIASFGQLFAPVSK